MDFIDGVVLFLILYLGVYSVSFIYYRAQVNFVPPSLHILERVWARKHFEIEGLK